MRTLGIGLGASTLFAVAYARGVRLTIARGDWLKVVIAGMFNVVFFSVGSAFAQIYGTTSRAVVIAYTMPIWSALLARIFLKEQFSRVNLIAVLLCAAGLAISGLAALARGLSAGRAAGSRLRLELGGRDDLIRNAPASRRRRLQWPRGNCCSAG